MVGKGNGKGKLEVNENYGIVENRSHKGLITGNKNIHKDHNSFGDEKLGGQVTSSVLVGKVLGGEDHRFL